MGTRLIPRAWPTACVLLLQLLLGTASRAADSVSDVIGRLEEQLNTALGRCDAVALGRMWDDNLVFVFPSGSVATKAERLAGLKRCTPGSPTSSNEAVDVRGYGDTAVAIVVSKWSGVADGKPFTSRFRATHVWAKRSEEWTLVAAHVSQIKE
jgi:ketosteroid isomerase-like protein